MEPQKTSPTFYDLVRQHFAFLEAAGWRQVYEEAARTPVPFQAAVGFEGPGCRVRVVCDRGDAWIDIAARHTPFLGGVRTGWQDLVYNLREAGVAEAQYDASVWNWDGTPFEQLDPSPQRLAAQVRHIAALVQPHAAGLCRYLF